MSGRVSSRPVSGTTWRLATILAGLALLFALLLGGLAAWFLGAVAIAGLTTAALTFNFHIPGALVRLFAIGRTAARYGERLAGHKAALDDQAAHRAALFARLAADPATRKAGWQLADQSRLTDYLDDVEDIDYARLRVNLPLVALGGGTAVCALATAWIAPLALVAIVAILASVVLTERATRRISLNLWERVRALRRAGSHRFGAVLSAATPLQAEGRWREAVADSVSGFCEADRTALALHRRQAGIEALAALAGPVAAIAVLAAAWSTGARGEALLPAMFVAFSWFALSEALQGTSRIAMARVRRQAAEHAMAARYGGEDEGPTAGCAAMVGTMRCAALQPRAPDGRALGAPVDLTLTAGRPTLLTGTSGAGKTSLLKQIAGWIGEDVFKSDHGPLPASARRAMTSLALHDAAVIADTVRANLFAPAASDEAIADALAAVELDARIAQAGGLEGWITQDMLSLGEVQRLGLARAWLSPRPVIVLDEPTEHLGAAMADRIMSRLLAHLSGRLVVIASHHAGELACLRPCRILALDARAPLAAEREGARVTSPPPVA